MIHGMVLLPSRGQGTSNARFIATCLCGWFVYDDLYLTDAREVWQDHHASALVDARWRHPDDDDADA